MIRPILQVTLAGLIGVATDATLAGESEPSTSAAQARALMAKALQADRGPGVQVAVVRDGRVIFEHALGRAHVELDVALEPDHRLRIGSVSKPVTALLTLRLAQEDILSLDDKLQALAPDLPEHLLELTIRQLASHTAGLRQYDFANFAEANNMLFHSRLVDATGSWSSDPLQAAPGSRFHYTSLGFNLIGVAIEAATGRPYSRALADFLTGPLGLDDIVVDHPLEPVDRRAGQYTVTYANPAFPWMEDGAVIRTIFRDSSDYYPSGGLLATARALACLVDAAMGGKVAGEEARDLLTRPAMLADGSEARFAEAGVDTYYGLGWIIRRGADGGVEWLGHDGETNGAYALVRHFPRSGISVAAIANYNVVAREAVFFDLLGRRLPELFHDQQG